MRSTSILIISFSLTFVAPSFAQIKPDKSLGTNSSIVFSNKRDNSRTSKLITGGSKKGDLLIHSFDKFNINSKEEAIFLPDSNIRKIITRVTNSKSFLNGSLFIDGRQSLIFVNPKGISIGRNFQSGFQGSITFSTATNLKFGKSFISATSKDISLDKSKKGNLSIIHNFSNQANGDFRISNTPKELSRINFVGFFPTPKINEIPRGLVLLPNQKLSIFSGDITLDGGIISALSGDVELISVRNGSITQFPDRRQSIYSNQNLGSITLNNQANIVNLNNEGNSLYLAANNIFFNKGSIISSFSNNPFQRNSGTINLRAKTITFISEKNPELFGVSGPIRSGILSNAEFGKGANIDIEAENFRIFGSSGLLTRATNNANGGDIQLNVLNKLILIGGESIVGSSGIGATAFKQANGGKIDVSAKDISLLDAASIQTNNFDEALSGDINVTAEDINISGINPFIPISSQIQTNSFGKRLAGNIDVHAKSIFLSDGGGIGSTTQNGTTGNVNINAERIELTGEIPGTVSRTRLYSSVQEQEEFLENLFNLSPEQRMPDGNASNLVVTADEVSVSNKAEISVRNDGQGDAGNLRIRANRTTVKNDGQIIAATRGGDGGNIFINSDILSLSDASILTNAQGQGIGGNIKIRSGLLSLIDKGQILANAQQNRAGNITIFSDASVLSNNSVIAASSLLGPQFNGNIDLNIQNQQVIAQQRIAPTLNPGISVADACSSGKNSLTEVPRKLHGEFITDPELIKAADLKKRQEAAEQFKFRDESGKVHTFRRWLGVEKLEGNKARFIYSSNQSDKLKKMLSSLDSKCKSFTS